MSCSFANRLSWIEIIDCLPFPIIPGPVRHSDELAREPGMGIGAESHGIFEKAAVFVLAEIKA